MSVSGSSSWTAAGLAVALFGACAGLSAESWETNGARPDADPPTILVLPVEPFRDGEPIELRAEIVDPSGVGQATVTLVEPPGGLLQSYAMKRGSDGIYVATVPAAAVSGDRLAYVVEATDRIGNGPRRMGRADSPYVVRRATPPPASAGDATRPSKALWIGILLGLAGIVALAMRVGSKPKGRHVTAPTRSRPEARPQADSYAESVEAVRAKLEEDIFWINLLHGLLDRSLSDAEPVLRRLASRPHTHPTQGKRFFPLALLRRRFAWARQANEEELRRRLDDVETDSDPPPGPPVGVDPSTGSGGGPRAGSAGWSMVELLVAMVVLTVLLGFGAVYLRPLERPLENAGGLLEGFVGQAQARAIASTKVHRVRPITADSLVVEHAESCSAGAWVLDPELRLELPRDVALAATDWSVCFDSRGIASDNIVVTLNHPDHEPVQLEVLKGGTLRWL